MNLHNLRGQLASLAARVPSATGPHLPTSEQAIRECQALVEKAKDEGWTPPDDGEPMSAEEEAALITRTLAEADAELGQAATGASGGFCLADHRCTALGAVGEGVSQCGVRTKNGTSTRTSV